MVYIVLLSGLSKETSTEYLVGNFLVCDLMPPSRVENVKIPENSEKIRGPPGSLRDHLQPFLGP